MKRKFIGVIVMLSSLTVGNALADNHQGTITKIEGQVQIFTNPGKTPQGPAPHAFYEGEYFSVRDAKMGEAVEQGNIVRTSPNGKARIVYDNGDHYSVGPGSAYRVFWGSNKGNDSNANETVNLMYGKVRGVVAKNGPRNKLTVRTHSATMGVRGTDFFVADGGKGAQTEVSVIRGSVAVKANAPKAAKNQPKNVDVKAGMSAEVKAIEVAAKTEGKKEEKPVAAPAIEVRQTTKEELVAIQNTSKVEATTEIKREIAEAEVKKLEQLEKKAVETTLKDIKNHDPKLYAKIDVKDPSAISNADQLNTVSVKKLEEVAPEAPPKRKPSLTELEAVDEDPYNKYFKVTQ